MIPKDDQELISELRRNGLVDEANALEAQLNGKSFWVGQFLTVKFPGLNKQPTLADNDARIREDARRDRCKVKKVYEVPGVVYDALGKTLMDNNSRWEKIGGRSSDDPAFDNISFENLMRDENLLKKFRAESYTEIVIVTDGKRTFAVNTEGYDYARYVGRVAETA